MEPNPESPSSPRGEHDPTTQLDPEALAAQTVQASALAITTQLDASAEDLALPQPNSPNSLPAIAQQRRI